MGGSEEEREGVRKGRREGDKPSLLSIKSSQDFGLDREKFCKLPEVLKSKCPTEFMDLAFQCCRVSV